MKKALIILFCIILIGCNKTKQEESSSIIITDNLNIEYGEELKLYDLVSLKNYSFITENIIINTMNLGNQTIKFKYKDINNKKKNYSFNINVVDTTKPVIMGRAKYSLNLFEEIDLLSFPICVDNYDKNVKCKLEGTFDNSIEGTYKMKFTATDSNGNYSEKEFDLIVNNYIEDNYYETETIYLIDALKKYKKDNTLIGIDVSSWQESIDWKKVKSQGIEFAMIRIGFGHNNKGELVLDNRYSENIKNAKEAGLKVGIYFYSYAANTNEALAQAKWILKILDGEKLDLPIAFDWEDWSDFYNYNFNLVEINNVAKTFLNTLSAKGYEVMNYGSALYLENIWNLKKYNTWLAHYINETDYEGEYYIWQFTNSGIVDGINGFVDLNVLYK